MGFLSAVGSLVSGALGYVNPAFGAVSSLATSGNLGALSGGFLDYSSGQSKLKDAYRRALRAEEFTARNSPSWTVDGLRRAGLNPILALQDGSVTAAHGVNPAMASGTSGDLSFSLKKRTEKENDLLDEQAKSASATASNLEANTAKALNEIKNDNLRTQSDIDLNAARQRNMDVDTANKFDTAGLSGTAGLAAGVLSKVVGEGINKKINPYYKYLDHSAKDRDSSFVRPLKSLSTSAKDYSRGIEKLEDVKSKLRREGYILHMR